MHSDDGLFRLPDGQVAPADESVRVAQGFIEKSNVNPAEAMVGLIANARRFELQMKLIADASSNAERANGILSAGTYTICQRDRGWSHRFISRESTMIRSLWISKTGLESQQTNMDVISNNLANVNTTGFKRGRAVFEDLMYQTMRQPGAQIGAANQLPTGLQIGTGVRTVAMERIHTPGNLKDTGNSLDVAIQGRGFLQVETPDGTEAYTRDGTLQV